MARKQDSYTVERTIDFPKATFIIRRPILTPDEHERRMQYVKDASAYLLFKGRKEQN